VPAQVVPRVARPTAQLGTRRVPIGNEAGADGMGGLLRERYAVRYTGVAETLVDGRHRGSRRQLGVVAAGDPRESATCAMVQVSIELFGFDRAAR
jgi:hypothetical protein